MTEPGPTISLNPAMISGARARTPASGVGSLIKHLPLSGEAAKHTSFGGLRAGGQAGPRLIARGNGCYASRMAAETRPTVALFVTCLVDLFRPTVGFAAVKLLEESGCQVKVPPRQTCCGQPAYNSGDRADAIALAKQ